MSKAINTGGPAFPQAEDYPGCEGMSLRDHYAGQAMAGMLANPGGPIQANSSSGWSFVNCRAHEVAEMAYQMADDMIRARSKEQS